MGGDVITLHTASPLTAGERNRLADLEGIVAHGLSAFVAAGNALRTIRDERLYRDEFSTFEAYTDERFGISRQHAYRLIGAADAAARVSPIGVIQPVTESQARPLTKLPPDEQPAAWRDVVDTAPRDAAGQPRVTAAHVERVVATRQQAKQKPTPAREVLPESPMGDSEPEPDPLEVVRAELMAADRRLREQDALIASLEAQDGGREIRALHSRIAQTEALLSQARAEAAEARRSATWANKQLAKAMRLLGLDDPRAVVPRIAELVQ